MHCWWAFKSKYDNIIFQSRLISGSYPNTSNLFPNECMLKVTVNLNDLYDVIDRASILTSDKDKNGFTDGHLEDICAFAKHGFEQAEFPCDY